MGRARIRSSQRVSPNTQTREARAARAASQTTTLRAMARDQAMAVETAAAADLETRSSRVRMIKGEAKVVSRSTLTVIGKTDDHFTFQSTLLN